MSRSRADTWLVLADASDPCASWIVEGLRARGREPLVWLRPEQLARGARWEHRLTRAGAELVIELAEGIVLESGAIRGTVNRLVSIPYGSLCEAHPQDRDYAGQELTAFFLSWLHALPGPMVNRPTPRGLAGAWRPRPEWLWLAARAGLPVAPYRQSHRASLAAGGGPTAASASGTRETALVVGEQVIGRRLPVSLHEGCRNLARLARTALLGLEFAIGAEADWTFIHASPLPDLSAGGQIVLDVLADTLAAGTELHA